MPLLPGHKPFTTLISPFELAQRIDLPGWVVVDCRHDLADVTFGRRAYWEAHIPGARFMHLDEDLSAEKTGKNGRHPLPTAEVFAARLTSVGISNNSQVVAYDDAGGMYAARLWWMLRWLGHDAVAVLDGGLQAWLAAGQGLSSEVRTQVAAAPFQPYPRACRVDVHWMAQNIGQPHLFLLDARSPDRFRGENETMDPVGGHIPGAMNRFYKDNLNSHGQFKSAGELRRIFDDLLQGTPPEHVVAQCGSGVTACHNLLALEVAGLYGARLYPGSWSEWCSDPCRPVEKG